MIWIALIISLTILMIAQMICETIQMKYEQLDELMDIIKENQDKINVKVINEGEDDNE